MELISQVLCAASKATEGSLTRSYGSAAPALKVRPGRKPGVPQVAPPSPERAKPMSVAPPLKKRPTWNVPTTVLPAAKVSGSTSVACWLVGFVNGSLLTRVSGTLASAAPTGAAKTVTAATATAPEKAFQYLTVCSLQRGQPRRRQQRRGRHHPAVIALPAHVPACQASEAAVQGFPQTWTL